ncbi:hypothetical protein DPMN_103439 [Dreissena polymorpha]|uniref:Uncharacterized protein n=1 Tax=Dreissena polymorpha TaxID=45954 RepID=A0A9D4H625_DREPO|nr:hypothetical protein DPMN_103439 [Dreissena polymorpha]
MAGKTCGKQNNIYISTYKHVKYELQEQLVGAGSAHLPRITGYTFAVFAAAGRDQGFKLTRAGAGSEVIWE